MITIQSLLSDEKYRLKSLEDLEEIVDSELSYDEYKLISGNKARDKAFNVKTYFELLNSENKIS